MGSTSRKGDLLTQTARGESRAGDKTIAGEPVGGKRGNAGLGVASLYKRLNGILDEAKFDEFAETACQNYYAEKMGRPGFTPWIYFQSLLGGYFEGIDSERGIAWRAAD
jgi:hypothetical protein